MSAGVLALALVAAVIFVVVGGSEDSGVPSPGGFEPVYHGLEDRREAAGVSTMAAPADPEAHLHPRLELWVNGEQIAIPVDIGIDPNQPPEEMASLHTHESDGTLHVEGMAKATLGQFFDIWGVPFSAQRLGPHEAQGEERIEVWADGQPSAQFRDLELVDGQEIVVAYGTADERAKARQ